MAGNSKDNAITVPDSTSLLRRMAAPPPKQAKHTTVKMLEMRRREKNEAANMLALTIASPERICQKMGMAAFDSCSSRRQYRQPMTIQLGKYKMLKDMTWLSTRVEALPPMASISCERPDSLSLVMTLTTW